MAIVTFSIEAGLMFVQTDDDDTYVLDTDDLSQAGAVLLRLLAEGRTITPDLLPMLPAPGTVSCTLPRCVDHNKTLLSRDEKRLDAIVTRWVRRPSVEATSLVTAPM